MSPEVPTEIATLAGGCFWCIEAIFREVEGIKQAVSGYTGGITANPTYDDVCSGRSGHAEALQVTFDPTVITYREILEIFFSVHDPTTLNRQGADVGTQYRSAIFYHDEEQKTIADSLKKEMEESRVWAEPIVTEVAPLNMFYPAEDYHREYFSQHPEQAYCQMVVSPKLNEFRKQWATRLKGRSAK